MKVKLTITVSGGTIPNTNHIKLYKKGSDIPIEELNYRGSDSFDFEELDGTYRLFVYVTKPRYSENAYIKVELDGNITLDEKASSNKLPTTYAGDKPKVLIYTFKTNSDEN